jgi:uncharacterized protein YicC (UPF0701 family)
MGIAAGMKDITQEIASSYEVRMVEVGKLKDEAKAMRKELTQGVAARKSEVKDMLKSFQASQKEMGTQLRKDLAQDNAKIKSEVKAMRKELTQGVAARKSEVKGMLGDFQRSRKQAGTQLQRELADYNRSRKQASAQLRRELADYVQGIKKEVTSMRQETQADLREASATWQELASIMRAKRAGVKVPPKVEVPVPEEKVPVEEGVPNLEAKLLTAIREHPAGITLAEVAESLGVAPVVLGRAARKLIDEGRIRREDRLYFPVSTE